jgi:hypothetical protein
MTSLKAYMKEIKAASRKKQTSHGGINTGTTKGVRYLTEAVRKMNQLECIVFSLY